MSLKVCSRQAGRRDISVLYPPSPHPASSEMVPGLNYNGLLVACHRRGVGEEVELDHIFLPLHCYFWSNNTLLFHSRAGAKHSWFVINPFGRGTEEEEGGGGRVECSFFACRCAQNGINVTLGARVSLPWWITEGITIMEIVIDWSFVSIYCSSLLLWPGRLKCYHVNSSKGCYRCLLCSHNGRALYVCRTPSIAVQSSPLIVPEVKREANWKIDRSQSLSGHRLGRRCKAINEGICVDFNLWRSSSILSISQLPILNLTEEM